MRQLFWAVVYMFGLALVSCQSQSNLSQVGAYSIGHNISDMVITDNRAYLTGLDGVLIILDLSNPLKPTQVGMLQLPGPVKALVIEEHYAYIVLQDIGLAIVDISDPASPDIVGTYQIDADKSIGVSILDIVVVGDYAYLASFADNLIIVDISDPANPVERSRFTEINTPYPSSDINGVSRVGNYLYLSVPVKDALANRLVILDISNPISPTIVGEFDQPAGIRDMVIKGNLAYVVDGDILSILDISTPVAPNLMGKYETPDIPVGVEVSGNYAFVADLAALRAIDISNPSKLIEIDSYPSAQISKAVEDKGFIYVLDNDDKLFGDQLRIFNFVEP